MQPFWLKQWGLRVIWGFVRKNKKKGKGIKVSTSECNYAMEIEAFWVRVHNFWGAKTGSSTHAAKILNFFFLIIACWWVATPPWKFVPFFNNNQLKYRNFVSFFNFFPQNLKHKFIKLTIFTKLINRSIINFY